MSRAGSQALFTEMSACSGQSGEKASFQETHHTMAISSADCLVPPPATRSLAQRCRISKYLKSEISTSSEIPELQS